MGPTASGKTDLAADIREHYPVEIISVDSALVYKGMDIGTGKPDAEFLQRAPHRLIDFLDPAEAYSAARFRDDALVEIEDILTQNRIPILVGGTMLYFRALLNGLSELPPADETIRARLEDEAKRVGWGAMHARLKQVDAEAAARIHPNDPQRIQRALEVYEATGVSMSEWYRRQQDDYRFPYRVVKLALIPSNRAVLHERIASRFHRMLQQGLVHEVEVLAKRADLGLDIPSIRAVGYRQVWKYLHGAYGYEEMIERAIIATRQLAKRQLTWLRSEPDVVEFDCLAPDLVRQALKLLKNVPI